MRFNRRAEIISELAGEKLKHINKNNSKNRFFRSGTIIEKKI